MIEYILDYLESNGQYANSAQEQKSLEEGISKYLLENGINQTESGEYFHLYVINHLKTIQENDLKKYFLNYELISSIQQIVMEYNCDGFIPQNTKKNLYELIDRLYSVGLEERYIPIDEIKIILGKYS